MAKEQVYYVKDMQFKITHCFNIVVHTHYFIFAALRDNRIELVRASWHELSISVSDVSLSDEGQYTCSLFTMPVKTSKAYLTVLGKYMVPYKCEGREMYITTATCFSKKQFGGLYQQAYFGFFPDTLLQRASKSDLFNFPFYKWTKDGLKII